MKMTRGYLPRITGRPDRLIRDVSVPKQLHLPLSRNGLNFVPTVDDGSDVSFGQPLAVAQMTGGSISLPSPAAGRITIEEHDGRTARLNLSVTNAQATPTQTVRSPERTSAEVMRDDLARNGLWQLFWSSGNQGIPPLDGSDTPQRLIVNCVMMEPFRARGNVVIADAWDQFLLGIGFLQRLLAEYGAIHLVLTEASNPLAVSIRKEMTGRAWIRLEHVPMRYPIEHPSVLYHGLRNPRPSPDEIIWVLDAQAVAAIGACLGQGMPPHERLIGIGGPGASSPEHARVRIGTPVKDVLPPEDQTARQMVLHGGLFQGEPVEDAVIGIRDDAIFVLPRAQHRDFMSFAKPGLDRNSILPCFLSKLTGAPDRRLDASLRGERRPCIACGLCESVCPADLMPQVLHRQLYGDALDEAEATGLMHCIACGLCSYVCPSKIELRHQFEEAQVLIRQEHAEAIAAEAERKQREENRRIEHEHSEEWRK